MKADPQKLVDVPDLRLSGYEVVEALESISRRFYDLKFKLITDD
jgi:hypothetical protein